MIIAPTLSSEPDRYRPPPPAASPDSTPHHRYPLLKARAAPPHWHDL